jgi:hypothetical protein
MGCANSPLAMADGTWLILPTKCNELGTLLETPLSRPDSLNGAVTKLREVI